MTQQSAREVIEQALCFSGKMSPTADVVADQILKALTAAGYPVEALADERDELKAELARTRQTLDSATQGRYRHIPVHDTDRKPTL